MGILKQNNNKRKQAESKHLETGACRFDGHKQGWAVRSYSLCLYYSDHQRLRHSAWLRSFHVPIIENTTMQLPCCIPAQVWQSLKSGVSCLDSREHCPCFVIKKGGMASECMSKGGRSSVSGERESKSRLS